MLTAALLLSTPATAGPSWTATRENGTLRVWMADGAERTLLRSKPDPGGTLAGDELASILEMERKQFEAWTAAKAPLARSAPDAAANENRWLDAQERLEELLVKDSDHLGAIRDVLVADCELLALENGTPLARDVMASAVRRLRVLESVRDPAPADRELESKVRARLFLSAEIYPAAMAALGEADASVLAKTLRAIGEGNYRVGEPLRAGTRPVVVWKNAASAPAGVLWGQTWFVAIAARGAPVETTAAAVLAESDGRWYLLIRRLDGTQLATLYGKKRPADADVRRAAEALLR